MAKRVTLGERLGQPAPADAATLIWGDDRARQVVELELVEIMPNPQQPRTVFDSAALEELASSIRVHGVLQPVLVQPIAPTQYEGHLRRFTLIAGERRWRASGLAGKMTIPALIVEGPHDTEALIALAVTENLQRADLTPLEEARAFAALNALGQSFSAIGQRLGKSQGYVINRVRLLQVDTELQQLATERPDTLKHVYELAKLSPSPERTALLSAIREGLSYKATQAQVAGLLGVAVLPGADVSGTAITPTGQTSLSRESTADVAEDTREATMPASPQTLSRESVSPRHQRAKSAAVPDDQPGQPAFSDATLSPVVALERVQQAMQVIRHQVEIVREALPALDAAGKAGLRQQSSAVLAMLEALCATLSH